MLNFQKEGQDILNFDLEPEVKTNVVKVFNKINRLAYSVMQQKNVKTVPAEYFLQELGVANIA